MPTGKQIERAVLADSQRPCLYNVAGPCQHPNCLEAHFKTLSGRAAELDAQQQPADGGQREDSLGRILDYAGKLREGDYQGKLANWQQEFDALMARKPQAPTAANVPSGLPEIPRYSHELVGSYAHWSVRPHLDANGAWCRWQDVWQCRIAAGRAVVDELVRRLKDAERNTSTTTFERTRYWLGQYRLLAQDAIAALRGKGGG